MLSLFRQLTALRRREPALNVGDYSSIESGINDIFAYRRSSDGHDTFLILLNFGSEAHTLNLSHLAETATIAVASDMIRSGDVALAELAIGANEGLVLRLK